MQNIYDIICFVYRFFHILFRKLKMHVQSRILMDEEKIRKQLTQSSLVNILLLLFFNFWSAEKKLAVFEKVNAIKACDQTCGDKLCVHKLHPIAQQASIVEQTTCIL